VNTRQRPVLRLVDPDSTERDGYRLSLVLNVDLEYEYTEYLEYQQVQPKEARRPFMDDISSVAREIVTKLVELKSVDAGGWTIALRSGSVEVVDTKAVLVSEDQRSEEPF
tara:strand:- start:281 stop:610 length:330 start_codon:yes stop_codon:yes gene_type:complete